jgi:two-component system sensor histidine kinase KdpD
VSTSSHITHVSAGDLLEDPVAPQRARVGGVGRRRQLTGLALALAGLPLLTLLLDGLRDTLSLEGQVLLYLLAVVVVALVGGVVVALLSAVAAALLINYYFVTPLHTLDIAHGDQAVSLGVFVLVAGVVSGAVELATRRARAAERHSAQADILATLAGADLDETETLRGVLARARTTFNMQTVALKVRDGASGEWFDVERAGWSAGDQEAPLRFDVPIDKHLRLIGRGPALFAEDQRVLHAFAHAAQTAYDGRRLTEQAREGRDLAVVDRQRTALLAAVGHDLRTPLATIKASVSTLRQDDVDWSADERRQLLATIEQSADRLDAVVANLLDASRLQAGALGVHAVAVTLDEVVGAAVLATTNGASGHIDVHVGDDLPMVQADPGLLERVLVNLLDNALQHGASSDRNVEVRAYALAHSAKVEIIDHGPGVPRDQHETLFEPFQRRGDRSSSPGVGLGLSVARGFTEAMGGGLVADQTPGGGLTMRLRLPLATADATAPEQP